MLVAQLIANNQQQQIRHDQTLLVQQQTTDLLRAQLKERYEAQEERAFHESRRRVHPARFLAKQTPADDIEAFLLTFDRTAERRVAYRPMGRTDCPVFVRHSSDHLPGLSHQTPDHL